MLKRDWTLLFSEFDLHQTLEEQLRSGDEKVRTISHPRFHEESDEFWVAFVASQLVVSPIELIEDRVAVSPREAKIDVSLDPNRVFLSPGPHFVDGLEVTYHLPYAGDSMLLRCKPNRFTFNPPRAIIASRELLFPYDAPHGKITATKAVFQEDLAQIREWLSWVNDQVHEYNRSLESRVQRLVQDRREEIERTAVDLADLGYPVRGEASGAPAVSDRTEDSVDRTSEGAAGVRPRYDVALSFAGEDREFVRRVAEVLDDAGIAVFYDEFKTLELWGTDLVEHLNGVYSEESHFVVIFISRYYPAKEWPRLEKRSAFSSHLLDGTHSLLPVRFDDTELTGLPKSIGYLDARALTPEKLAKLIQQKIQVSS